MNENKPPMPPEVKKLFEEWEELGKRHKAALAAKDYESAREISRTITAFVTRHQKELKIPDEAFAEMIRLDEKVETSYEKSRKTKKTAKDSERRARQAEDDYYRKLLEKMPRGKGSTGH